ncbi:MAG: methionine--tRNA ligase subunit beta, partial [Peptococcus niger]
NLVSRTVAMIDKYFDGLLPAPSDKVAAPDDDLRHLATDTPDQAAKHLDVLQFPLALESIWQLIRRANKYIDETTPWVLAKDSDQRDRLATVLYNLYESIRIITTLLKPFMPALPGRCGDQLNYDFSDALWADAAVWGKAQAGTKVHKGEALFPRIDPKSLDLPAEKEAGSTAEPAPTGKPAIAYDDFAKLDLRLAKVLACEPVEKADRLLKFRLDIGDEERTVVSGIRSAYADPSDLVGKQVILVANLAPRKIRGIESHGMLLTAASEDDAVLELLQVHKEMPAGSEIS